MTSKKRILAAAACAVFITACGGSAEESTTTTAASGPSTTAGAVADTTMDSATTSTTAVETTTTTGPGTGATGDLSLIQAAMAKSSESAPARVEGVIMMSGMAAESGVTDVEMPFSVTTDAATGNSAIVMDFGAMAAQMGDSEGMPEEMADLMGSMEMREIGDIVYLKFPFMTAFMGAQTEWVSMPAEEGSGIAEGMGSGATPTDPTSFLDSFADADGTVEELGSEDVRGIATTRYQVVLDDTWRDNLAPEELAELEEQGPLPSTSFPMDLWLDDDGLVHRMSMEMDGSDMALSADEQFESMTMTFDFFDFGESVVIEAPPADQVTDSSELAGAFGAIAP